MILSLLNTGGITPPLDGRTPVFVEVGADPSVSPGVDLPPGSIALRGGSTYYWKVDTGATDWVTTPFSGGGGGGGITNVTGTDGVTVTTPVAGVKNATNDLVTGVDVAQLNVDSLGTATIDAAASISLTSAGGAVNLTTSSADDINLTSGLAITGTAVGLIDLQAGASLGLTSGDAMGLHALGGDLVLDVQGAHDLLVTPNRDETHTVGRAFSVTAAGAAGITLTTTHASSGPISLNSGHGDINLTAADDGKITGSSAGETTFTSSGGRIALTAAGGDLELTTTGASHDVLISSGEDIAASANAGLVLTGATAATLESNTGNVIVRTTGGTGGILIDTKGGTLPTADSIRLNSDEDVFVHADDDISIAADDGVTIGSGGGMTLDSTGTMTLTTQAAANDINIQSGDDILISSADHITLDSTTLLNIFSDTAILIDSQPGPLTINTGDDLQINTHGGDVEINSDGGDMPVNLGVGAFNLQCGTFSIFGGPGASSFGTFGPITGGTVQDAECRAALDDIVTALTAWGFLA